MSTRVFDPFKFKLLRRAKRLSQAEMALLLRVSRMQVIRWETGEQSCPPSRWTKIATKLDCPLESITATIEELEGRGDRFDQDGFFKLARRKRRGK